MPELCGNWIFVQKWFESKSVPNHGLVLHIAEPGNEKFLFLCMISGLL
jgi:hypothetical protein